MAKAVGLIGSMRGKVGNVVYRTRRGVQITSVYQPTVLNPKSARQASSREVFAVATRMAKACKLFLRAGLQSVRPSYECQKFVSGIVPTANGCFSMVGAILTPDYALMANYMAAGELGLGLQARSLSLVEEGEVSFSVSYPESFAQDEGGNEVNVGIISCVYCPDVNQAVIQAKAVRDASDLDVTVEVPTVMSGLKVHVYCFIKQIPTSGNLVPSMDTPWMYPARTSIPIWVGTGTIA